MENKFVTDIAMTFLSETICPIIAMNTSVCAGGSRNLGGPLLDAFAKAFLDPEYFCANTIVMCNPENFQIYHAEDYVNKMLESKPAIL